MNAKCFVLPFLAVTLILAPVSTHAQPQGCGEKGQHHQMWADLGLNEDQKAKLKSLFSEMKEQRKSNFEAMQAIRIKTREELLTAKPSNATLDTYAKEMGELHSVMSKNNNEHMLKVKTVLTAEQFSKLVSKGIDGRHGCKMMPGEAGCKKMQGAGCKMMSGETGCKKMQGGDGSMLEKKSCCAQQKSCPKNMNSSEKIAP
jgi:Spy/CpxP family protein refolding chaperone